MATETLPPPAAAKPAAAAPEVAKPNRPGFYEEAFAGLDELEQKSPKPATEKPEKPAKPAAEAKPPADKPAEKPAAPKPAPEKPVADKPAAPAKPAAEPEKKGEGEAEPTTPGEPDPTAKFTTAHDLRKDWWRLHKAVKDKDKELAELRTKAEAKPTAAPEPIIQENKALKKRLEEVEGEMRYLDYTKSQEFRDKFEKPYQEAYDDAIEEVKELQAITEDGGSRPATAQDFQRILQAETQDVRKLANELFGEAAGDVLAMRRRLIEMNRNANREAKRYREEAGKREQERAAKAVEEREGLRKLWNEAVESIPKKYPDYFAHREGDDEWNKELDAGYAVVDKAHAEGLPIEEKVARLAALRHRAAAFRPLVMERNKLKARVAELEEVVRGYEESAPKGGKGGSEASRVGGADTNGAPPSAFDELDEIDRRSVVHE